MSKKNPNNHKSGIREKKGGKKNWYKDVLSSIAVYNYLFYIL